MRQDSPYSTNSFRVQLLTGAGGTPLDRDLAEIVVFSVGPGGCLPRRLLVKPAV